MSKRRKFTPEFKSQVVLQLLSGEKSMAELVPFYQLHHQRYTIYWHLDQGI